MPKKKHTYALYYGNTKVYIGTTDDMDRRLAEHEADGKKFTRAEKNLSHHVGRLCQSKRN